MRVGMIRRISFANIPSLLALLLTLETKLVHCLLAWVLVNECWKVVHHCNIDKLLGRLDHVQKSIKVVRPTSGTERSGGGLCVRGGRKER